MKEVSDLTSENRHLAQPLPQQKDMVDIHQHSQVNACKDLSVESLIGPLVLMLYDMTFNCTVKYYFSTEHLPH